MKNDELIGKTFGRLTVLGDIGKRTKNKNVLWECQCTCGNKVYALSGNLKKGSIKSCGCLNDELRRSRFKDLTGYENENFKVIERDQSRNQRVDWRCLCKHCGNDTILNSTQIEQYNSCGCLKKGASKEYMASITNREAKKNDKPTKRSTTGVRGVYFNKRKSTYQAFINVNKKSIYLGSSKNFDEVVKLRKDAEVEYGYKQTSK